MKLTWVKRSDGKFETEYLYAGTIRVASIILDRDLCGHLVYVGFHSLPSLHIRSQNILKDALKTEMEALVVAWFIDANKEYQEENLNELLD